MIKCSVTMDSSYVAVDSVKVNLEKKKKKKIKENKLRIQKKGRALLVADIIFIYVFQIYEPIQRSGYRVYRNDNWHQTMGLNFLKTLNPTESGSHFKTKMPFHQRKHSCL